MNQQVISCPVCSVKLKFTSTTLSTIVDCPKCGERISFNTQEQRDEIIEVEPVSENEIADNVAANRVQLSDSSSIGLTALLILLLVVLPMGIIVGGAYLVYDTLTSSETEIAQSDGRAAAAPQIRVKNARRQDAIVPQPATPEHPGSGAGDSSSAAKPVRPPAKRKVAPPPESSTQPDRGRVAEEPDGVEADLEDPGTEDPGTENPGTEDPANHAPGTEAPGTEEAAPSGGVPRQPAVIVENFEELKYHWAQGDEHVYSVSISAGQDAAMDKIHGQCTYKVSHGGLEQNEEVDVTGTGFVVTADGYIATCAHVVAGAKAIDVVIGDKSYRGKVVVKNGQLDLAILKIEASGLSVPHLGDSDRVQLAERVRAFGFPLSSVLGTGLKSASGEVSGIVTHPRHGKQIQTDAPINSGNSGGPMVNEAGQIIGIASSKIAARFASSVGFAVPINELKKMLVTQGLQVPSAGPEEKLAGPELAKKVTPSVAFIKVKSVLGGQVFDVKYSSYYSVTKAFDPSQVRISRSPFPRDERDTGTVRVNSVGEVIEFQGKSNLPFLLGPLAQLFIQPVDPDGNKVWSTESEGMISIVKKSEAPDPLRRGLPPSLGRPFGSGGPRFSGLPRNPFQREEPEETVKDISAIERVHYEIIEVDGDRVTIRKKYQFVTQDDEERPYFNVKGVGTFVFDRKVGMPAKMTYRATITKNDEEGAFSVPLNVSYELRDPEEVKRQREETRARIAEQNRQQEEWRTVPNAENVEKILADVEPRSMSIGVISPMQELSTVAIVPEKRTKVMEVAKQHMAYDNNFVAGLAAEVVAKWSTRVHVETLKEIFLERNLSYRKAKKMAAKKLIEIDEQQFFPSMVDEMEDTGFRYELKKILIEAGPEMEQPILDAFDKFSDNSIRRNLLDVLKEIGTRKSIPLLEELERNDGSLKYPAKRALAEIRKR